MKRNHKIVILIIATFSFAALAGIWWVLVGYNSALATTAKWAMRSREYKAELSAQPEPNNAELKHLEWESWGWGGEDTFVYVVFDPTDSLSVADGHHQGKYKGIPCEVFRMRRLERHWYTVQFYTSDAWGPSCR
jgi:hypothetical protein